MDNEQKKMTQKEIDKTIDNIKGIWGIEGMKMTEEEEKIHRAYLAGEISEEENNACFFVKEK